MTEYGHTQTVYFQKEVWAKLKQEVIKTKKGVSTLVNEYIKKNIKWLQCGNIVDTVIKDSQPECTLESIVLKDVESITIPWKIELK